VRVLHAGPGGAYSDDGTMEILKKWRIPVSFCAIDEGFGVVRTKAIRSSPCDWVMVLDADERFFPVHRGLACTGESTPHSEVDAILQTYDFHDLSTMLPNWENVARLGANLQVDVGEVYDQGARLRDMLAPVWGYFDAIAVTRRHWHDFSFKRPTQNWHTDPDPQMRLVRNHESIYFDPGTRMHERLVGADRVYGSGRPLFFDHFHFTFKRMEPEQRAHDVAIYDAVHAGKSPPTWKEFKGSV
jgi:glycosyltransferase involved in cell wall biosynthesis